MSETNPPAERVFCGFHPAPGADRMRETFLSDALFCAEESAVARADSVAIVHRLGFPDSATISPAQFGRAPDFGAASDMQPAVVPPYPAEVFPGYRSWQTGWTNPSGYYNSSWRQTQPAETMPVFRPGAALAQQPTEVFPAMPIQRPDITSKDPQWRYGISGMELQKADVMSAKAKLNGALQNVSSSDRHAVEGLTNAIADGDIRQLESQLKAQGTDPQRLHTLVREADQCLAGSHSAVRLNFTADGNVLVYSTTAPVGQAMAFSPDGQFVDKFTVAIAPGSSMRLNGPYKGGGSARDMLQDLSDVAISSMEGVRNGHRRWDRSDEKGILF